MIQSTFLRTTSGIHAAIIMDGNGRWACRRGSPRHHGHRAGANAVRRVIESAPDAGVTTLTLYAFSSDNWERPAEEVVSLLRLFQAYLIRELASCCEHGVRVNVIGRRDRLPRGLVRMIEKAESETRLGQQLHLRLAIDYSSRDSLLRVATGCSIGLPCSRKDFSRKLNLAIHSDRETPEVDLLIRTGGEKRLSDFLLWESAYAELYFSDVLWPDFSAADLSMAVRDFLRRQRRFGKVQTPSREDLHEHPFENERGSPTGRQISTAQDPTTEDPPDQSLLSQGSPRQLWKARVDTNPGPDQHCGGDTPGVGGRVLG